MDMSQAISMKHVGVISGAIVTERPTADGSVWIVKLETNRSLPNSASYLLEIARGGTKIFKGVQAALNDVKTIGIEKAIVQFTSADSFRRNRFEWLYEWIRGLYQTGMNDAQMLETFLKFNNADASDKETVKLASIIIQHAIGKSDGKELEAYLPPIEVLNIKYLKPTDEGYLCQATCPDSEHDFIFLVALDVTEKNLKQVISEYRVAFCRYVLAAAHRRHPQGYTDPDAKFKPGEPIVCAAAGFRLYADDIDCIVAAGSATIAKSG